MLMAKLLHTILMLSRERQPVIRYFGGPWRPWIVRKRVGLSTRQKLAACSMSFASTLTNERTNIRIASSPVTAAARLGDSPFHRTVQLVPAADIHGSPTTNRARTRK